MSKLERCPLSAEQREAYGRCLDPERKGITCKTCHLLPGKEAVQLLTPSELDALEASVKGFTGSFDWEQASWDRELVVDDRGALLIDCSEHDCGEQMAEAICKMRNELPSLLAAARKLIEVIAERSPPLTPGECAEIERIYSRATGRTLESTIQTTAETFQSLVFLSRELSRELIKAHARLALYENCPVCGEKIQANGECPDCGDTEGT